MSTKVEVDACERCGRTSWCNCCSICRDSDSYNCYCCYDCEKTEDRCECEWCEYCGENVTMGNCPDVLCSDCGTRYPPEDEYCQMCFEVLILEVELEEAQRLREFQDLLAYRRNTRFVPAENQRAFR